MPISSGWPLKTGDIRFFVPLFASTALARHPLTKSLYLNGMGLYIRAQGHTMARSEHEDNLFMFCSEGEGFVKVQDEHFSVSAGDMICLPKGVTHQYGSSEHKPWTLYWVHFDGEHAQDYWQHMNIPSNQVVVSVGSHPKIISDFETLFSARQTGYSMKAFIHAAQCLKQMLTYIALLSGKHMQSARNQIDLDTIQAMMQASLNSDIHLEELARQANLSKYHFSKRYKELTGYSPIQHFIHLKIERACYLLDISSQPISQVSANLGYDDPHYFSRLFKKTTGLSPREYRKLDRG